MALTLRTATNFGAHAMIWGAVNQASKTNFGLRDQPFVGRDRLFEQAARLGVSHIRINHNVGMPLASLDENLELCRRWSLRPLLLLGWGAAADETDWLAQLPAVVDRAKWIVEQWEILNEPDVPNFYPGTTTSYTSLLNSANTTIKAAQPSAVILNGGLTTKTNAGWIAGSHDIHNAHVRGSLTTNQAMGAWATYFGAGTIHVTEHDYPADPAYQTDPAHQGEAGQGTFLLSTMTTILNTAGRLYLTLRDLGGFANPTFHSTGLLANSDIDLGADASNLRRRTAYFNVAGRIFQTHAFIGRNAITVTRQRGRITAQLTGDAGCRYKRRMILQRKTNRGWEKIDAERTDPNGRARFRSGRRRLRVVAPADGVCLRCVAEL